ncbi:MAG: peptidoglycan D,D-transpeptidase FtsI family protein [Elusimicrobiota bacterium]
MALGNLLRQATLLRFDSKKSSPILFKNSRLFGVKIFVVFIFLVLASRLVYVQAVIGSQLQKRADKQIKSKIENKITRHKIVDRNGKTLAETVPVSSCFVDPTLLDNKKQTAKILSRILNLNETMLAKKIISAKGSFLWVKRNLSVDELKQLRNLDISGIALKSELRRNYPLGPLAPHLLGLVGTENHGLSGVEKDFESTLSRNEEHKKLFSGELIPSGNVQLTIDADIQGIVERELDWGAKKTGSKRGMVVVQSPSTGEILAMAAWPPLELTPDNPPHSKELRIPPLVDVFEPGSTFKIVTIAGAIEENIFTSKSHFNGENGKWKISAITIHDHEPITRMSFEEILIHSSNIGTGKVADVLGRDRLYQYARLFGFGVFPGSGLSGEAKGVLRTPSQWSGVSKFVVSFGQEMGVTMFQMTGAFSSIANKGVLMEPKIIKAILSDTGEKLKVFPPNQVRRVVSEETALKVTKNLVRVVKEGTGVNAQIQWASDCDVAGKTGTAQKFDQKNKRYHKDHTVISFCGFFPAHNPRYTIFVVLDEPEGRRFGGLDAAPVFRRIAEQIHGDQKILVPESLKS